MNSYINLYDDKNTKFFETRNSYENMISFCQAHLTVLNENSRESLGRVENHLNH